jgi:hypothetical protein
MPFQVTQIRVETVLELQPVVFFLMASEENSVWPEGSDAKFDSGLWPYTCRCFIPIGANHLTLIKPMSHPTLYCFTTFTCSGRSVSVLTIMV